MTLSIYAESDYLADVATTTGWSDFIDWAETVEGSPRLRELAEDGCCDEPAELLAELQAIDPPSDPDVASVLKGIVAALDDLPEIADVATVIVSDGFGDDDDDDDDDD